TRLIVQHYQVAEPCLPLPYMRLYRVIVLKTFKETFPELWTKSVVVAIPKKGDLQLRENYRTISFIVHASKILLEVIRRRLKPHVETHLSEEQAGFRPGRSTLEQIFVWRQLAERYIEAHD